MNFPLSKKLTAAVLLAALTATSIAPGAVLAADSSDNVATVQPGGDQPPEKPPGDQQPTPPDGGKPGEQPPAKPGGADTMEYDYTGELSGAITADGEEVTRDSETISTETKDQNVGLAQNGGSLTLTDATLDKSGSDTNGDNCNFYGINSILLSVNDDSVIKVADSKLTADSTGSNAIFATDGGTVYANNNTIVTSASNSRGLDATYGGTVIGNLLAISTAGDHSAALATDRGGGNISLTNSSLYTALGVSKEDIFTDYEKTNTMREAANKEVLAKMKAQGMDNNMLGAIKAALCVDVDYLQISYDTAEKEYGSFENYIVRGIDFDEEQWQKLRKMYLE